MSINNIKILINSFFVHLINDIATRVKQDRVYKENIKSTTLCRDNVVT